MHFVRSIINHGFRCDQKSLGEFLSAAAPLGAIFDNWCCWVIFLRLVDALGQAILGIYL